MNEEQIETFIAVAEHRSFSTAANKLFISQPSVTHRIVTLETELGITLFDRSKRSLRLTIEGEHLLPLAINTMENFRQMYSIANQTKVNTKTIVIGFPEMMLTGEKKAFTALMGKVNGLCDINTELRHLKPAPMHCQQLLNGELDVIFTDIDLPELQSPKIETREMFSSKTYICMSKTHHLAIHNMITFDMLRQEQIAWYEDQTAFSEKVRAILKQNGISNFQYSSQTKLQLLQTLNHSSSVTISNMVDKGIADIAFIPLDIPAMRIGIAWLKTRQSDYLEQVINSILSIPVRVWRR